MSIEAMKQAIKQAEKQKPYGYFRYDIQLDAWVQNREKNIGVAFYTAPPKREWVGLTEDEVSAAVDDCDVYFDDEFLVDFARRIEAKLREKNGF